MLEGGEEINNVDTCGRNSPERGKSKCKVTEVRGTLACLTASRRLERNEEESSKR